MTNQNLIVKVFEGSNVFFMEDGYINATKAAKNHNKDVRDWLRLDQTLDYAVELAKSLNLFDLGLEPQLKLIQKCEKQSVKRVKTLQVLQELTLIKIKSGSPSTGGGTWIHPKLGIVFSRWLSTKFAIWYDDQIELIIRQQKQTPAQQHIQHVLDLLYNPVNLMSFEQISLSERLAQRSFTWNSFQELFRMKNNTYFLRVIIGIINRQVLGMSAGRFRVQVLGPKQFRIINGQTVRFDIITNNVPRNLTKDFLPKPHQECIQRIMQDLFEYFSVRPGWTREDVKLKVREFIITRKGIIEMKIGRNLHDLIRECILQVAIYSTAHNVSPYDVVQNNLIQLNYNQMALERDIRQQRLQSM